MENKKLSVKEVFEAISEICKRSGITCNDCAIKKLVGNGNCLEKIPEHLDEVIKILKQWKDVHKQIQTEWAYICRIIEKNWDGSKRCVYEQDITGSKDIFLESESVLKEYCKNHKGEYIAVFEYVCRVKENG